VNQTFTTTFKDHESGHTHRIRFEWVPSKWGWLSQKKGLYRLYSEQRPACTHSLGNAAHLLDEDEICLRVQPDTKDRAKAMALLWIRAFGIYCRTGKFPNDGGRVNVA